MVEDGLGPNQPRIVATTTQSQNLIPQPRITPLSKFTKLPGLKLNQTG